MRLAELKDARVAIWGYGREGRAALTALRRRFPDKELTLFCSEAEAKGIAGSLLTVVAGVPDAAALSRYDVVVKSPGISPYRSPLPEAMRSGVHFISGSALWFAEHREALTICVTGTKGKSTVAALIAHVLRKSGKCIALAGNIGMPLLDLIEPGLAPASCPPPHAGEEELASRSARQSNSMASLPDWWVIELSSFQTRDFDGAPTVAVINNLYEEHLDWHLTRDNYAADKLAIATNAGRLVINAQTPLVERTAGHNNRSVFGTQIGWHVRDDAVWRAQQRVLPLAVLPVPGLHNAQNVCASLAAIEAAGFDAAALAPHVATFKPLPHRLQPLGTRTGIEYINDSISTTPYATIEALRSVAGRAVSVIVGGFERGVDWSPFVEYVARHAPRAIVTAGANGARIVEALCTLEAPGFVLASAPSLDKALECARALTPAGGAILLSPGAPSFDQFRDYAERGREFTRLAGFDPDAIAQIEGLGIL
jgi:UDP-N-acetylmuramoylalanine-D-glutamate ligase